MELVFVISLEFIYNRKALYIQCSHGNDLQGYRSIDVPKLDSFKHKFA